MPYVHLNEPSGCKCGDLPGVSNDATSRELARAVCGFDSTAAAWFRCSKEPAPLPVPFFSFPLPSLFWPPSEPDWFFGFDQHSVLGFIVGSQWKSLSALFVPLQSQSPTVLGQLGFQQSTSRCLDSKHVVVLAMFIICTSSSTVASLFCTDGHVNCNCLDSFHCAGSREHKDVSFPTQIFNTLLKHQVPQTILVYKPSSATMMRFYDT